jgi:E3 ubiquitin-protein ligase BOI and related proteins
MRLIEKESELETAKQRNIQLEEKLTQTNAEMYVWFDMAKNNEAIAMALRAKLDQAILAMAEGSGGCDGHNADDAQSSCVEGSEERADVARRRRRVCGVCGGNDACVLLLPCRHLCLCKECEPMSATCPLCFSMKNASLEISFC